ncbi:uncharacterized protein K460DRAFT_68278 [Cucurbitaria berberidis CBS 394.84]|uniref:Uncharacterized protein n=1 Tax=Cucurbitaria berberidis CBS 394.84 TaxID=1168544 RepID=A0A9P4LAK2_9PLEO|nr:uncharacterized protein K460DRAFT_68278 [Cucurbitaria berberidis CBS 394.84]KAF1848135.1 hypothetical protein K460DRAFT_68278 [Cucurbitaria berberidis CBS 394.84]
MIQTGVHSMASTNLAMSGEVTEMREMMNQLVPLLQPTGANTGPYQMISQSLPDSTERFQYLSSGSSSRQFSDRTVSRKTVSKKAKKASSGVRSPICDCPSESRSTTHLYSFWGLVFQHDYQQPSKHLRGCKFYGIDRKAQRSIKAQIPFKMEWFFTRASYVCVAYTNGCNNPAMSIRLKNIVPRDRCPVYAELMELHNHFQSTEYLSSENVIRRLKTFERSVLSIYREGKASPSDRNEMGKSFLMEFIDELMWNIRMVREVTSDQSITGVVLQIFQTFMDILPAQDKTLNSSFLVFGLQSSFFILRQNERMNAQRMVSYLMDLSEVNLDAILFNYRDSDIIPLLNHLSLVDEMEVSPMARAILRRSLRDLDDQISRDPKGPIETLSGYTTLQLCIDWPQGLQKLLTTEAKSLIDNEGISSISRGMKVGYLQPVYWAIRLNCAESVNLLMKAGSSMASDKSLYMVFSKITSDTAAVIASNMADRRRKLLELAQRELGDFERQNPTHVADREAAYLCGALEKAGIYIPPYLRVGQDYTTVYHTPVIRIDHFRIYFEQGFQDFKSRNNMGLTPIMIWRDDAFNLPLQSFDQIFGTLLWLQEQGALDQNPEDPWALRFNITVTGWHYVAAMLGSGCLFANRHDLTSRVSFAWKIIRELSQTMIRDRCTCSCNHEGEGCSPLKSLWNAHAKHGGLLLYHPGRSERNPLRHILFHHNVNTMSTKVNERSNLSLQIIRLLTFEALDMTHTCCALEELNLEQKRLCIASDRPANLSIGNPTYVIANRDPEWIRKIRSDRREQQDARQLEVLMEDFAEQMKSLDTSPKALEIFIWGYWRRRMSELFVVHPGILNETERVLGNVETYVVPGRLKAFLGDDFDWLRYDDQATPEEGEGDEEEDTSSVESIGVSRYCSFCDGPDSKRDGGGG